MSSRDSRAAGTDKARILAGRQSAEDDRRLRRQPRQERARATVAAITEAAAQLLVAVGYARVSTNLIARRAGVSVGSLYQYFPNKETIYAAILEEHIEEMRSQAQQAMVTMADERHDFPTGLRRVLDGMVQAHTHDDDLMRAMERELSQVFPQWRGSKAEDDEMVDEIAAILARRRDCRPTDPAVAARLVLTLCQGVTKWLLHNAPAGVKAATYLDETVATCALAAGFHRTD